MAKSHGGAAVAAENSVIELFAGYRPFYQGELGHPTHYPKQSTLMVLAYHGANLPVANTAFFCNDGGTFVNTDTISDLASFIL